MSCLDPKYAGCVYKVTVTIDSLGNIVWICPLAPGTSAVVLICDREGPKRVKGHGDPGGLCGPMGAYGHLWGPMGTYQDLWGPMGTYGDLWGPNGTYGELLGPMGTYGVGGINFLHTHFDTNPPPAPSSKHQICMRHITPLVVYTAKTTCHIRHQTSDFIHNPAAQFVPSTMCYCPSMRCGASVYTNFPNIACQID